MITNELIAALDDLLQAGASASSALRSKLEQLAGSSTEPRLLQMLTQVAVSQGVINNVKTAQRTEQTVPQLLVQARDAVQRLGTIASSVGESSLAGSLTSKVKSISAQMKASGVGMPWLTILGLGAGAIAAFFLWKNYSKKRRIASFVRPDPEDNGERVRQMGRSLGAFRKFGGSSCRPQLGRAGKRLGRLGAPPEKYEFEPEIRLEGIHRGSRRIRSKR